MIARVARVDRDDRKVAQVLALIGMERQFGGQFGFVDRIGIEGERNAVLVNRDQAERARGERIAQHGGDLDPGARTAPDRLGQHQLTFLRPAQIGDRHRIALALVDRGEPRLAGTVQLDHAHRLIDRGGQLLHRVSDPAPHSAWAGLFGPRQHAVARPERAVAALQGAQPDPWRRDGIVGSPAVRHGNRLALVDLDDPQHGDLGHPAHAVERGAVAVDQAFLGHVLEHRFELDFLLPLEPESSRDLTLASGIVAVGDEIEDLLARGQARWVLGHQRSGANWPPGTAEETGLSSPVTCPPATADRPNSQSSARTPINSVLKNPSLSGAPG